MDSPDYNAEVTEVVLREPVEYARMSVDVASELQASDIVLLDISEVSDFADYFVILTADSARQLENLAEEIESSLERSGATRHHIEGTPSTGWILLDFGDVIVHLFGREAREFYRIEGVWSRAQEVVRIQ